MVQIEMFKPRGGKRCGAGRPAKGPRASERHKSRPRVVASVPQHIVLRAMTGLDLRCRGVFAAVRTAVRHANKQQATRIVHLSIQRTHVHLIVETTDKTSLAKGIQGFAISAARRINRALGRKRGQVFSDRYHAVPLTSPRQVRNTIAYVLNNWRHHGEQKRAVARQWTKDPFSSAILFDGWKETNGARPGNPYPETYDPLPTVKPRTWLLRTGWRKHPLISFFEVPGGAE